MPSTGIIEELNYQNPSLSGQSYAEWKIKNIGQSGLCWTELYDTTARIGIYQDTSYYYTGQSIQHNKIVNIIPSGNVFKLTSGHFDGFNRIQDDQEFFYIAY